MIYQFTFTDAITYEDDPAGIKILVTLENGNAVEKVTAKVDTGAAVCLFSREIGERLGLLIEAGLPCRLNTLTGPIDAFGYEITLQTGNSILHSTVYFAKHLGLPRNLLGREGWLRKSKIAIVDYDNRLYLGAY